jgi:hypothetical protein
MRRWKRDINFEGIEKKWPRSRPWPSQSCENRLRQMEKSKTCSVMVRDGLANLPEVTVTVECCGLFALPFYRRLHHCKWELYSRSRRGRRVQTVQLELYMYICVSAHAQSKLILSWCTSMVRWRDLQISPGLHILDTWVASTQLICSTLHNPQLTSVSRGDVYYIILKKFQWSFTPAESVTKCATSGSVIHGKMESIIFWDVRHTVP